MKNIKKNLNIRTAEDKRYVVIPKSVLDKEGLTATAKIVFGMIHAFDKEWNGISVRYIKESMSLADTTIQKALRDLKAEGLIDWRYRAKYRMFKSLLGTDKDAKAIIPFSILNMEISSSYKITYGMLLAAGLNDLGAYNFNEVSELAMHLGLSISSVYRHINTLLGIQVIERDETAKFMFYTLDRYSKDKRVTLRRKAYERKRKEEACKVGDIYIDPDTDAALDQLFNRI